MYPPVRAFANSAPGMYNAGAERASAPMLSATTDATSAPVLSSPRLNVRAPMIGGSNPEDYGVTGQRQIQMAPQIAAKPVTAPNHITATGDASGNNKFSEEATHMAWAASLRNYGNTPAAENDFAANVAKYGINGHDWVADWRKNATPNMRTETTVDRGAPTPVSMLGTDKSGGTPPPGLISMERGMSIAGAPRVTTTTAPLKGYSTVGDDFMLPSTSSMATTMSSPEAQGTKARAMKPMLAIRDKAQAPLTTADAQRAQNMEAGNVAESGAGHIAASPVTQREQFQAGTQIAETAAGQPLAVANTRAKAVTDAAAISAQGRVDAAKENAKRPVGGRNDPNAPPKLSWREVNAAYNKLSSTGMLNDQEIEDKLNKLYGPGALDQLRKATTQPTADDGRDRVPQAAAPATQPSGTTLRPTPQATAQQAMQAAGGDHQKARQILAQNGYDANDIR